MSSVEYMKKHFKLQPFNAPRPLPAYFCQHCKNNSLIPELFSCLVETKEKIKRSVESKRESK